MWPDTVSEQHILSSEHHDDPQQQQRCNTHIPVPASEVSQDNDASARLERSKAARQSLATQQTHLRVVTLLLL